MYCSTCGCPVLYDQQCCPVCGNAPRDLPLRLCAPKRSRRWIPVLILILLFSVGTLLFWLIPVSGNDASPPAADTSGNSIAPDSCFSVSGGVLTFHPENYNGERIIIVPAYIGEEAVTAIGAGCFSGCTGFTTLLLPNTVTSIGDRAFADCTELRGALLPEGITSVGSGAFLNCRSLESVYIPLSLSHIGSGAFEGCPKLFYIFYNGFYREWERLYTEYITPYTFVSCLDGDYYHTGEHS